MEVLTQQEKDNIEAWRLTEKPTKHECVNLQIYKNKILKSLDLKAEKRKCFCSHPDRVAYKAEFYTYYDNLNAPLPTTNA